MKIKIGVLLGMILYVGSAWSMAIETFHKWARKESGKTTQELVAGYDQLTCLAHRMLADHMLKRYRQTSVNALRNELAIASGKQPAPASEEDEWPEL